MSEKEKKNAEAGSWSHYYTLVIVTEVLIIISLSFFTRYFK